MENYRFVAKSSFVRAKYRVAFNKLLCLVNDCLRNLDELSARHYREKLSDIKGEIYPILSKDVALTDEPTLQTNFANAFFKSQFYENAPIGFFILNTSAGIIDFNQKASEYWGLTAGSFKGVSIYSLLDARFGIKMNQMLREVLESRKDRSFECICRRLNGSLFFARFQLSVASGGLAASDIILLSVVDISEEFNKHRIIRSIAKSASTETEAEFMTHLMRLLSAIDQVGLVVIALKGQEQEEPIVYWNQGPEIKSDILSDYRIPYLGSLKENSQEAVLPPDQTNYLLNCLIGHEGEFLKTSLNSYIRSPQDKCIGHISLFFETEPKDLELHQDILDIFAYRITQEKIRYEYMRKEQSIKESLEVMVAERTKDLDQKARRLEKEIENRKEAESKLLVAKRKAESANRAKSLFLANMSHEIRTPLNGILGIVSILRNTRSKKKRDEYIEIVSRSGSVLTRIIDDILDLSRLEAGQIQVQQRPFNLRETILEIYHSHLPLALNKRLEFNIFYPFNLPEMFLGDSTRLRQIIDNLVSNAIKYTDKGWVTVFVSVKKRGSGMAFLSIKVTDSGGGISKEQRRLIWRRFERLDHSTTRKADGFGLGLAITRKLIHLMKARIVLDSRPGLGSSFGSYFFLPLAQVSQPSYRLRHQDIYLLSSCPKRRRRLAALLSSSGYSVTSSHYPANLAIDITAATVIGDITTASERLLFKDWVARGGRLTKGAAFVTSPHKELLRQLPRPLIKFEYEAFLSGIADALAPAIEQRNTSSKVSPLPKSIRVLLAEDNLVNQKVSFEMLRILGVKADIAENGKIAVAMATQSNYQLILMDCFMPEMDGVEAMHQIKSMVPDAPPIIAVTANAIKGERERYLTEGFDAYLAKPFKIDELRSLLMNFLEVSPIPSFAALNCDKIDQAHGISPELS